MNGKRHLSLVEIGLKAKDLMIYIRERLGPLIDESIEQTRKAGPRLHDAFNAAGEILNILEGKTLHEGEDKFNLHFPEVSECPIARQCQAKQKKGSDLLLFDRSTDPPPEAIMPPTKKDKPFSLTDAGWPYPEEP